MWRNHRYRTNYHFERMGRKMITNRELKLCREQVFTYSNSYQVPFYGREASIKEMKRLSENLEPHNILIISQPLGTGKTFLVNNMIANKKLNVPDGVEFLTVRRIAENPECMERFPGNTLIVDEADIKTSPKKLIKGLDNLREYININDKNAILLGDYSLKSPDMSNHLGKTQQLLGFEDIDKKFLLGALQERFLFFIKKLQDEDFSVEDVISEELIDYLAPEWMKPANSFRGIFSLLQDVVSNDECVRFNSNQAYLSVDTMRNYFATRRDNILPSQKQFYNLLCDYIHEMYPGGNGITIGFTAEELYELAANCGIHMDITKFEDEILEPLARADVLVSRGIPGYRDTDGKYIKRPAPYLPSLRTLLYANIRRDSNE